MIFAAVADEEAGGEHGARGLVERVPSSSTTPDGRPAAAALNEVGGYSITLDGRRFYTIQVAEKGIAWTRLRTTGTPATARCPRGQRGDQARRRRRPRWRTIRPSGRPG